MAAALSVIVTVAPALAENRWVTIHNHTGYDIMTFHGSHVGTNSWQEDILGNSILPAGNSININFDDGTGYCVFDFRAEFEDGDVLVKEDVNICEIGNFYYN
jgi:hypothetical protein